MEQSVQLAAETEQPAALQRQVAPLAVTDCWAAIDKWPSNPLIMLLNVSFTVHYQDRVRDIVPPPVVQCPSFPNSALALPPNSGVPSARFVFF